MRNFLSHKVSLLAYFTCSIKDNRKNDKTVYGKQLNKIPFLKLRQPVNK